jgi:catechol 2,3-dioxygenase-like lactoylglutathione lyase family enzyme
MKAIIGHFGINLSNPGRSFDFWKDLFNYFEFVITGEVFHFHASDGHSEFCITATEEKYIKNGFHRKNTGLNHVAFKVNSQEQVDQFVSEFLKPRNISTLYGGEKSYPDYANEYYAVYFEDPDRIKIEVVYEK